jgi:predicted MFS family arabinose efflux permease
MDKRRSIPVFLALTATYWASLYTYVPILSPYGQHLGASLGMIGLVVAAYGLSQLVLRVPAGIASDRLGVRRPFLWAGFVAAVAAAICMGLAQNPWGLLLGRGVAGVAATMWVTFTVLFAGYFPSDQTNRAMAILMFCTSIAQLAATYAGGWMAEFWGWKAPFGAAVFLGLIGMALTSLVTDTPLQKEQTVSLGDLLRVGKSPQLLVVSLLAALSQYLTFVTVYGFTPAYAATIGASKAQLGTLTLVSSVPTAVASLLGGTWLAGRLGERRVVVGGFLLATAATFAIPYTTSIPLLYLTQAIGGVGRGVVFPVLMGLSIRTVTLEKKATAMGFFQSIYALGMTGGPAISGFLGNALGMRGIFVSAGFVGLAAALLGWLAFETLLQRGRPDRAPVLPA